MFRRLRARLDRVESQLTRTAKDAREGISEARVLLEAIRGLVDEIEDGVSLKVVRTGEASIMDFVTGQADELPLGVKVEIEE